LITFSGFRFGLVTAQICPFYYIDAEFTQNLRRSVRNSLERRRQS
jgi:hypothetical protein